MSLKQHGKFNQFQPQWVSNVVSRTSSVSFTPESAHRLLVLLFLLFLSCCSQADEQETSQNAATSGVTPTEIRVGSSLALSGHAGYLGSETLRGAQAYIQYVNESGGIHGRKVTIVALDDRYDPPLCLANTQRLIVEENIFCLFCYVGTPTAVKILPLVEKAKVPLIGMFTGANALRDPHNPMIINVRASYYQETGAAVEHLVGDIGLTKIAVMYQYDAYGLDGLRGAELALQKYGLAPVAKGSYIRGTLDVEEGLDTILASEAQAVVMIGTYEPCAKFIRLAREQEHGNSMIFYNVSFVGAEELARLLGPQGEGVIVSQVVPPPELLETREMLSTVRQYLRLLRRYSPGERPNSVSLEGYYNALVLVEGLRRAGRDLTREGLVRAIETIQNYPLGTDTSLNFSPKDHQGMDRVYFTRIHDGRLTLITDWRKLAGTYGITPTEPPRRIPGAGSDASTPLSSKETVRN